MKRKRIVLGVCIGLLLGIGGGARSGYASVVLAEELWNDGDEGTPTWGADETYVTVGYTTGGGREYLNIGYDPGRADGEDTAVVYTDAGGFFAGAWDDASQDGAWIAFDFWADEHTPDALQLQFGDGVGNYWSYDLSTASLGAGWIDFSASLTYNASLWTYSAGGGDQAAFLDDLANIDWIGVSVADTDYSNGNNYGLDNYQLMVPEPEEYALAISALLVVLLAVRQKRKPVPVQAA